jgi:collagenase-like PrtC family protease
MLSQENQQVFVLNSIQTMSGYVYNLGNELKSMAGIVDMVRLSPMGKRRLPCSTPSRQWTSAFAADSKQYCNGFWRRLPGLGST